MKVLVVRGVSAYDVLGRAADEISKGFKNCGYEVDMIDAAAEHAAEALAAVGERVGEYAFYFSMQALFWNMEQRELPWVQKLRRVGWIVDDPIYHVPRLEGTTGRDAHLLTIQTEHAERARRQYPQIDEVRVLYHGGFCSTDMPEWKKKDIDVFFSGTYVSIREAEKGIGQLNDVFRRIAETLKDGLIGKNADCVWSEAVRDYLRKISFDVTEEEFRDILEVLSPLEMYQRAWVRTKMIGELLKSGIQVSVAGNGWEKYEGEGKENLHIIAAEGIPIDETVRLMGRAKIVLHCMNFFSGMHERIFTAMLANAVCVSYSYKTLYDFFENGTELVTFPLNQIERLPEIVSDLLEHPDKAEKIAVAGFQAAKEKHTWERRGEQIAEWMQSGKEFSY